MEAGNSVTDNRTDYSSAIRGNTDYSPNLEGMASSGSDVLKGVKGAEMGVGGRSQMM